MSAKYIEKERGLQCWILYIKWKKGGILYIGKESSCEWGWEASVRVKEENQ